MLILIPIYNRTTILKWVLKSVENSTFQNELVKVCVVNNHPQTKDIVNKIVSEFKNNSRFIWITIHREVTMIHVKSWYSTLYSYAREGEVVLMLGDDDFLLPWSSDFRYRSMLNQHADMLLTNFFDRLYFFKNSSNYWLSKDFSLLNFQSQTTREWDFKPGIDPEASFISNHTYRFTEKFREGLDLAFNWCEEQNWLPEIVRMGMLPLYLPYAISLKGGKVIAMNSICVIRGAIVPDVYKEEYAGGGSTQLYLLCAYDTFSNMSLKNYSKKLKLAADFYEPLAKTFDIDLFLINNVKLNSIFKLYNHAKIKSYQLININTFKSIFIFLIKRIFRLTGFRLKLIEKTKNLPHISYLYKKFADD